jgi:alanine racemase
LGLLRAEVAPAEVLAVVKADAYGHGAARVARALEGEGVGSLAVAFAEEGRVLRDAGVTASILVFGPADPGSFDDWRDLRLEPTVSSLGQLAAWRDWATERSVSQPIHLKFDSGMTRLGIAAADADAALEVVRGSTALRLRSVFSHLAMADDPHGSATPLQVEVFERVLARLRAEERGATTIHLANSGGALYHPNTRYAQVRIGLALYGVDPAHAGRFAARLQPVMQVKARLVSVREVPAGVPLGYGGRRVTVRPSRIGVVPVGYADGYAWRLGDRAEMLLADGTRIAVVGAVSMDMSLVDLTGTTAREGDEVVLLGSCGGSTIDAWELAGLAGTIPWEVTCRLGQRLERRPIEAAEPLEGSR